VNVTIGRKIWSLEWCWPRPADPHFPFIYRKKDPEGEWGWYKFWWLYLDWEVDYGC